MATIAGIDESAAIGFVASSMGSAREKNSSGNSQAKQLQSSHQEDPHGSSGCVQRNCPSIDVARESSQWEGAITGSDKKPLPVTRFNYVMSVPWKSEQAFEDMNARGVLADYGA